jgi:hypothetical protein
MINALKPQNKRTDAVIESHRNGAFAYSVKWLTLMEFSNSAHLAE